MKEKQTVTKTLVVVFEVDRENAEDIDDRFDHNSAAALDIIVCHRDEVVEVTLK